MGNIIIIDYNISQIYSDIVLYILFIKLFYGHCSFLIQQIPVCFSNEQTIILTLYGVMYCIYWTGILQSNKKITLRDNNKSDILVLRFYQLFVSIIIEKVRFLIRYFYDELNWLSFWWLEDIEVVTYSLLWISTLIKHC